MTSVKTAISIREPLFRQVEALAEELNLSRSRLFALAIEEFIQRYQNRRLLEEINRAHDDSPDSDEQKQLEMMQRQHLQLVEGEW